jgi:hypothetical protein
MGEWLASDARRGIARLRAVKPRDFGHSRPQSGLGSRTSASNRSSRSDQPADPAGEVPPSQPR